MIRRACLRQRRWARDTGVVMAALPTVQRPCVHEVTPEEGRAILDRAARRRLHMSGDEFIRRWDAGEYEGKADRPDVSRVAMLLPFGR